MKKLYYFIIIAFVSTVNVVCMEYDQDKQKRKMQKHRENSWFLRNSNEKVKKDDLAKKINNLTLCQKRVVAIKTSRIPLYPDYPFINKLDISDTIEEKLKNISIFSSKEYNTIKQSVRDNIGLEGISQENLEKNIVPELFVLWKNIRDESTPEICARFYAAVLTTKKEKIYCILAGSLTKTSSSKNQANHVHLLQYIKNLATSYGCKTIYNHTVCDETQRWWEQRGYGKEGNIKKLI